MVGAILREAVVAAGVYTVQINYPSSTDALGA
jgi:hypothetical protein